MQADDDDGGRFGREIARFAAQTLQAEAGRVRSIEGKEAAMGRVVEDAAASISLKVAVLGRSGWTPGKLREWRAAAEQGFHAGMAEIARSG